MPSDDRSAPRPWLRNALLVIAAWTVVGLFYFSQNLLQLRLSKDPTPLHWPLVTWLVSVYVGALSTPAVLWMGRRWPLRRRRPWRPLLLHLGASLVYALVQLVVVAAILPLFKVYPNVMKGPVEAFFVMLLFGFHPAVLTYGTILSLQAGWLYYRRFTERRDEAARLELRAAELQAQLAQSQLGALKAQLQPHFLFNTLNAIMSLVRQARNEQAEIMLGRLADLLRAVLDDASAQEVPLRRELEYTRLYLAIEEVRFEDRLRVEFDAQPGLLDALVPHLVLQPLVENAIRHGIGRSAAAGRIAIRARREGDVLQLVVEDDGPGLAVADPRRPAGIGLENTRARLERLHGGAATLTLEERAPHGVAVTIAVPWREADATDPGAVTCAVHQPRR